MDKNEKQPEKSPYFLVERNGSKAVVHWEKLKPGDKIVEINSKGRKPAQVKI